MSFTNMLVIPDGAPEMFFGVLVIVCVTVIIYTIAFIELQKKKAHALHLAKVAAVEGLNKKKAELMQENSDIEDKEDDDEYENIY